MMMRFSPCAIVGKRYQQDAVALVELGGVSKRRSLDDAKILRSEINEPSVLHNQ